MAEKSYVIRPGYLITTGLFLVAAAFYRSGVPTIGAGFCLLGILSAVLLCMQLSNEYDDEPSDYQ